MKQKSGIGLGNITVNGLIFSIMILALLVMSIIMKEAGTMPMILFACIPMLVATLVLIFKNPFQGFIILFVINYMVVGLIRYSGIDGLSVFADLLIIFTFGAVLLNRTFVRTRTYQYTLNNGLVYIGIMWALYCCLELLNPSAMTSAWLMSRGTAFYLLIMPMLTFLIIDNFKRVESMLMLLSVLTLVGVFKGLIQEYSGFDSVEQKLLADGMSRTHILHTGIRYFSFYASAGIYGAAMGHALVVFGIASLYVKSRPKRIYYIIVAVAAFYGLLASGTRGALAVPGTAILLFSILSRNVKLAVPSIVTAIGLYVFLTMTTIGQGNATIRRVRSAFDPNEPSLMVRLDNQRKLGEYLQNKPFGEGLGLSGVESQGVSERFTTSIPTDSWFVKIWVETGIVGLVLHVGLLMCIIIYGSYIILFRLKDPYIRGILTALLCGVAGILVSSYGNMVLGQFPIVMIIFMSMAIVYMGPYFEKQKNEQERIAAEEQAQKSLEQQNIQEERRSSIQSSAQ